MSVTELGPHEQEFERTPPHDIAAEQGVLGGMLLSQDAIAEVVEVLRTQDFYRPAHQIIYDIVLDLYGRGDPADAVTVAGELTKRGEIGRIGGAPYLHTLISSVPTAANAGYYAKIVHERSVLRRLVETGTRIVQMGYAADGADADEVLDRAQAEVFAIAEKRAGEDYVALSEIMPGALDEIEAIGSRGGQMVGCPTGFADLDALTNGLHPGQMIVVAARPAMGKALGLDTPLPTPAGWTTMGRVAVGDHLIGADGKPTRVVAATEVMHGRPCYEIEFSDGEVIVADARHQWRTLADDHGGPAGGRGESTSARPDAPARRPGGRAVAGGERPVADGTAPDRCGTVNDLRAHQRAAVHRAFESARPLLASGTGAGKTRAYLSALTADVLGLGLDTSFEAACVMTEPVRHGGGAHPWAVAATGARGETEPGAGVRPLPSKRRPCAASAGGSPRPGRPPHARPLGRGGPGRQDHHAGSHAAGGAERAPLAARSRIRTTEEIFASVRRDGRPVHAVEVAGAFDLPDADLPVDPYVLGVWLGAGEGGDAAITCLDGAVIAQIELAGQPVVPEPFPGCYRLPGLRDRLAALGVLDGGHVPAVYLRASIAQRRALLAGLLDVCGKTSPGGRVAVAVASARLAEGLRELVLGLGHRAALTVDPAGDPLGEPMHQIAFTPHETVFRSPRKAERQSVAVHRDARVRHIVDVRPVASVPVRCVQVDNADHMYLAGRSCIPTHNSTLALDFARAASIKHGLTSAFFSLEMGRNEITMRLLSAEARVALHAMRSGTMQDEDWTRLARRMSEVAEAPLFIDDSPNMSMMEIRAKCRRLKQQHDLRLVIIDYLQLMTSGKRVESRQVEVSEFSRSLKLLAKELGVPVIALSQLNRGPEQRTDKKPMVSDLRESGCVTASTRIMRADTNEEIAIGELLASGAHDVPVWSLDERLKYVPRTMTHAFPSGRKEVFRVTLASGKQIEATANHPFLTYSGWTPLGELEPGARVATARHVPPPLKPVAWPEAEVVLLAHLTGAGSFVKRQPIRYASRDEACLQAVTEAARHFGITAVRDEYAAARVTTLRLPAPYRLSHGRRNPIAEWLDGLGLCGLRSHEKFVPASVFGLSKEQIALFLRHLWSTDGCVHWDAERGRCTVYYASTSRRLVEDVSRLLLRFGIHSRIKTVTKGDYRPGYQLYLYGAENQLAFFNAVRVHGARGVVAAEAAESLRNLRSNTNRDTVPREVWQDVRRILAERRMTHREFSAAIGTEFSGSSLWKRAPSRQRLGRVATVLGSAELEMLCTNDVFWDEIVGVESIGEQDVYDATVLGLHNFVANGISLHNSIEQDADMVILLHREDAYEKESPRAGEADLIVAKHRNGPTATVTVAFQGHYSRFVDMAQ
ncbi:replicative DNA helicase [Actinomadura opuntiae]|uniref:replicative DNA helicase n=1 Tax=Actinomadura sp. OS1-43 TaxID=604315 RepID=UPI00255A83BD|nr:replicative DNA helicase [Actinomadura sp. OS1-43]MDL4816679.1 replicative DNA helicase [Actinomadura sp. OS1-43]